MSRNFLVDKYERKDKDKYKKTETNTKKEGFNKIYIMSRNFLAQLRKISPPPQDSSAVSQIPGFYFIAGES